jgi:hypothetical protein
MVLQALAPGLWWVPAQPGEADAVNRGQINHLLLASSGGRLWLIGSGPTPAFGRRLAALLRGRWGPRPLTVVSPWPHPELVLGVAGLGDALHVAHTEVAAQMARRCAGCVERLRQRLGPSADDLGAGDPFRAPTSLLTGDSGGLGPWRWWRLDRAADTTVTVWQHTASGIVFAPGLLGDGGVPDGRDADIDRLARSTAALAALPGLRTVRGWIGEQGALLPPSAAREAAGYWNALQSAVATGLDRGDSGITPPTTLPGIPSAHTIHPHHALNWQRAWRQAEEAWLQRSLR